VRAAAGEDHPRTRRKRGEQQPDQQIMRQVIDRESALEAFGRPFEARELQPAIADQRIDRRACGNCIGKGADRGQRGQIELPHFGRKAGRSARCTARADHQLRACIGHMPRRDLAETGGCPCHDDPHRRRFRLV